MCVFSVDICICVYIDAREKDANVVCVWVVVRGVWMRCVCVP